MSAPKTSPPVPGKEDNIFAGKEAFLWETYLSARPDYRLSSFYDIIYSYHGSHSNEWTAAYDVGCGPGQVANELTSKFGQVHGSDSNEYIINVAAKMSGSKSNLDFEVCGCEDIVARDPTRAATGDLVTAAECITLMNTDAAMAAFARLLKPNGTLAIWFHGGPIYVSPDAGDEMVEKVQALHRKITDRSLDEFRPYWKSSWKQACTKCSAWLDNIPFDSELWKDVKRLKWNSDRQLGFTDWETYDYDFQADLINYIRKEEAVEEHDNIDFWMRKNIDFQWSKGFIDAQIPRTKDYLTEEVQLLYGEMEALMKGHRWDVGWPVVLLLATKK